MYSDLQTCPCCGYKTISDEYESCEICGWRYDEAQQSMPDFPGGANTISLRQAQLNFASFGAKDKQRLDMVRQVTVNDVRDPKWRPLDPL
jgi:hypothetical protein